MAVIVNNESSLQGDPTEDAIRQALAGMDLATVKDSLTASRYAVSAVDQANVPTLVGAQIGGNTGTQGGTGQNIIGQDSVVAETQGNLTVIKLVSDQGGGGLPGNTYYYGTGPTGIKGFFTVASTMAVASTSRMTQTIGADGVSTFDLATVADSGAGALLAITRDAYGRVSGTKAATITGTATRITVANGDASEGVPTIDLDPITDTGGGSLLKFVRDAWGRITGTSAPAIADLKSAGLVVPQGYIDGLQMVWNSATSISVTSGTAYIPSLGNVLASNSTLTLSGLSLTASTWYHVYLYSNAGTPEIELVTTAPFNYYGTAYQKTGDNTRRYIGSLKTNATSQIYQFNSDDGKVYFGSIDISRVLSSGGATVSTAIDISSVVPFTAISSISRWTNLSNSTAISTQISVGSIIYSNLPATVAGLNYVVIMDMACPGLALAYFNSASGGATYLDIIGYSYQR